MYKRSKILINRPFQLKMSFILSTWVVVLALIYPLVIFYAFDQFTQSLLDSSPEVMALINARRQELLISVSILYVAFALIIFFMTLFVSHRIAGPIFKLKRALEQAINGDYSDKIRFRKYDYFTELADTYNELMEVLQNDGKLAQNSDRMKKICSRIENISERVEPSLKQELDGIVASLTSR